MYILERKLKSSHRLFLRRMEWRAWCVEVNSSCSLSQEIWRKSSDSNFSGPGRAAILHCLIHGLTCYIYWSILKWTSIFFLNFTLNVNQTLMRRLVKVNDIVNWEKERDLNKLKLLIFFSQWRESVYKKDNSYKNVKIFCHSCRLQVGEAGFSIFRW